MCWPEPRDVASCSYNAERENRGHPRTEESTERVPSPSALGRKPLGDGPWRRDRKSTRLNSSHSQISYAVFCLKKKKKWLSIIKNHCTRHTTGITDAYVR